MPPPGEWIDLDTGEVLTPFNQASKPKHYNDCETGEQTQIRVVCQRSKFRVPRSALKVKVFDTAVHDSAKMDSENNFDLSLLFLPVLILLPVWAVVAYVMAEVMYHAYTHSHHQRTHKPCKTPLHILFSVTCAECVAEREMQKVGKLQDERTLKINSRRILNYDYAQFGISS